MLSRSSRLPLLILAVTLGIVFHRLLLGEVFFWGLPSLQFYPWREYAFSMLREGQLPLWNFYNGAGAPLLANYQSALLYPPNWLGFFLPLAWQMSITAVLHLFIAGWGMYKFTGRLGLPALGQGVATLSYALTAYLVARLGTYPTITAAAWIPWILWAALGVLTEFRRLDIAWLALFSAMQLLAGHAQTTWYGMLLVGTFSAWWIVSHRPFRWRRLFIVFVGLVFGAGIAMIQLLPTAELLVESQRSSGVDYDFAMNFSYSFPRLLNLLSPNIFGNPGDGTYIAKGAFFEDAVYVGFIPLISALAALITWSWGKFRAWERPLHYASVSFWLITVTVGFIFALGENTPIFPFLYRYIPSFSLFQAPVRWHIWTVTGLSVLAGIGGGAWGRGYWLFFGTRLAVAASVGAAILALLAPQILPSDVITNEGVGVIIRAVVVTSIVAALAGILTLLQPEDKFGRRYAWWVVAVWVVIAIDLAYAAQGLNPTIHASFYEPGPSANANSVRAYWPEVVDEPVRYETFLPFDDYRVTSKNSDAFRQSGLANLNLINRIPLLNNFDPLRIGYFESYLELIENNPDQRETLLRAAGVGALYNTEGNLTFLEQRSNRAWIVEFVCWHPDEQSLTSSMLDPNWQPYRQVHLLGPGDCPEVPPSSDLIGEIVQLNHRGNAIELVIETESPGWLVIANTYYPGWKAESNSQGPYALYRANLAFMAVELPPENSNVHQDITLTYRPWWLLVGGATSLISLMVVIILFRSKSSSANS